MQRERATRVVLLGGLSSNQPIVAVFECLTFRAAVNVPSTSNSAMMRGFLAAVMADIAVQCGRRTVVQNWQQQKGGMKSTGISITM